MLVGIVNLFRNHTANQTEPTIQPTIVHYNQATVTGHSDWEYLPLRILDSGTDVRSRGSGKNIDNHAGVNPQGPIVARIPETNIASNYNIFDSIIRSSNLTYRGLSWNGSEKRESENLGGKKIFQNAESKNNFEVEKVERKSSVIWNHKYSDLIHNYHIRTDLNQTRPDNSKNIVSINDSAIIIIIYNNNR